MSTCTRAQGFALAPTACAYEPPGETFTAKYFYLSDNYRPQRSWAKVMFLQASVILSTGGSPAGRTHPPPPVGEPLPPGGEPPGKEIPLGGEPPQEEEPPPRDTVNKQPVRILLECILVEYQNILHDEYIRQ